ncbi:hypothetical protein CJ179_38730 [Rhodococcus sp. ACS1]|uniref:hypothetical protein n=1 Tax=Rhodococcus sp. ACS1 TaxID=2028570 RepID=UPI000BB10698|nr:hypothetical protein [Rhodococcus sp. ACS1]PBC38537.1 hypothetical protein CJ179_38730 [Rhodococcus sp. ACS1]
MADETTPEELTDEEIFNQKFGALETAVREYVTYMSDGGYATDWVLFSARTSVENPDSTGYTHAMNRGVPYHTMLGLLEHAPDVILPSFHSVYEEEYYEEGDDE